MSIIILDFGSGETCKNDKEIVKRMIDELVAVDSRKHQVFIKWQLFVRCETAPVPPLDHDVFDFAFKYAQQFDYLTFASFFDYPSLDFLLGYQAHGLPAVKIACRPWLYPMMKEVPRELPIYISIAEGGYESLLREMYPGKTIRTLCCVPEYPANQTKYETFGYHLSLGISDHSLDLRLFLEYEPLYYERHYKLGDSTGLDAGPFAATPGQLRKIL